ncbi:NuoI/complex I 23 kDa subunit family protein [Sphaerisporangium dianthi]|uniref:NADH-quinone oxidoreductase subunit I n=1 Tax=Sphaerisporangium dianthi TaxID=1436120 RepID=A0ABV9CBG7_9ACTN
MARIPGEGLAKGLAVTFRHMLNRADTRQYPEVHPDLPARSRGVIALVEENCTVCMLCARECPDWCIYIDSHKETAPAPEGGRPRAHNVLDRFAIDFSLCMYCGICIEVCPFDALFWSPEFEYAEYDIRNLLHEKDRLGEWVETVPIPPAHDPNAEPPKEVAAASRGATRPTRERAAPRRAGEAAPGAVQPPGAASPGAAPEPGATAGPAEPERTSHAAVRAIRPPGALPKKPVPPPEPPPGRERESKPEAGPKQGPESPTDAGPKQGAESPTESRPESGTVEES